MIVPEHKIKGLIVAGLILAIMSLAGFFYHLISKDEMPVSTHQCPDCLAIEIVDHHSGGIYFVPPGTLVNQLLESADIKQRAKNNFALKSGMKLIVNCTSANQDLLVTNIPASERLALGMLIDINGVTEDDLLLIKGIGPATAQKILDLRRKLHCFKDMNQLMEIKGIKEKKLAEIKKYLYIEKQQE